jgi:hypothetical protein
VAGREQCGAAAVFRGAELPLPHLLTPSNGKSGRVVAARFWK